MALLADFGFCVDGFPPSPLFLSLDSLGRSELDWFPLPLSLGGSEEGSEDADFGGDVGSALFDSGLGGVFCEELRLAAAGLAAADLGRESLVSNSALAVFESLGVGFPPGKSPWIGADVCALSEESEP